MRKLSILLSSLLIITFSSCDNWLDIKPTDKVSEGDLLKDAEGVKVALNGIYMQLATSRLYGWELSGGTLDVLGQLYSIDPTTSSGSPHKYLEISEYKHESLSSKDMFNGVWNATYRLIANVNNLLLKIVPLKEQGLSIKQYNTIRGELYGLRAFLHFDMLRIFGPMIHEKEKLAIPYYTKYTTEVQPLLVFDEIIELVEKDLMYAESLLLDDDIFIHNDNVSKRRFSMNFFAVKFLQARVALYKGDRASARAISRSLVASVGGMATSMEKIFPYVTNESATSATHTDRVFQSEVIFGIHNSLKYEMYDSYYEYKLPTEEILIPNYDFVFTKMFQGDRNDYRLNSWNEYPGQGRSIEFLKYQKTQNANEIPVQSLFKKSELLLMLAETTDQFDEARFALNTLYVNRGHQSGAVDRFLTGSEVLPEFIRNEYRKEFYGEGQYFFYLKRRGIKSELNQAMKVDVELGPKQYSIPLPDAENRFN